MRTFQRENDRFWTIDRRGTAISVSFGKVGGKGQTRKIVAGPELVARRTYLRMIREKLQEGYVETTPAAPPLGPTGQALESALVESPDDVAAHAAYADWLAEQPDPALQARGELIRVQLALEDEDLPEDQRRKLQRREKQLRKANEEDWLGPRLTELLGDGEGAVIDSLRDYSRGWLSRLSVPMLDAQTAAILAEAPALRLLRTLLIEDVGDAPDPYAPLAGATNLGNVRQLTVINDPLEGDVAELVAALPRLEELSLLAYGLDPSRTFALRSLENLRYLHVAEASNYPIRELAANPALGKLEVLLLVPPGLEEDEQPYLRLAAVRALVRSKNLPALKNLTLHRSDMGDAGCREIADSGILGRIDILDLTHGCITDEGARILAGAKHYKHLEQLIVVDNRLTEEGLDLLRRRGLELLADNQQIPDERGRYDDTYLYEEESLATPEGDLIEEDRD
jgi:uncharacterized protein (TIGR02996 family)